MSLKFVPPAQPPSRSFQRFENCAALPLRLVAGFGFMAHGWAKLARGPEFFMGTLGGLHVPAPALMAWVTILVELLGGLALLAGAFVTAASVPLAITVLVAIFTVHLPYGFSSVKLQAVTAAGPQFGPPGYEVALFYLACMGALILGGPGPYSVDGLIARGRAWDKAVQKDET